MSAVRRKAVPLALYAIACGQMGRSCRHRPCDFILIGLVCDRYHALDVVGSCNGKWLGENTQTGALQYPIQKSVIVILGPDGLAIALFRLAWRAELATLMNNRNLYVVHHCSAALHSLV